MSGSSQRWPLNAFQPVSLGWPTKQHVLLLAQQQVKQVGYCRRWGDAGDQSWGGGAGGILGGQTASVQAAVTGGGSKIRDVIELLILQWDNCKGQGRRNFGICCALRSGWGCKVCFKWGQWVFSTFPCRGPHCWSLNIFSTQPSQLVLGRDLISNAVWNSISPVRRALTMELPCAWWVMSALIYCSWVLWKCLKTVTLPHCWALGLHTVARQKVVTEMGPFRGEEKHSKAATDALQCY